MSLLSVCLSVCLSARMTRKPDGRTSLNFCARSSSDGVEIHYVYFGVVNGVTCFHNALWRVECRLFLQSDETRQA